MRHVESLDFDLVDLSFIGDIILVLENRGVTVWYQSSRLAQIGGYLGDLRIVVLGTKSLLITIFINLKFNSDVFEDNCWR